MKTASTKLAHSTSSGMVESASNKPYLLLEAFFTFINFGEETILDLKDAWVLGFLWGKRPLFVLEQVPAPRGTSASSFVKCWDTRGWYRLGQTISGFFQPRGFVLFMPANLCPFNDWFLSTTMAGPCGDMAKNKEGPTGSSPGPLQGATVLSFSQPLGSLAVGS